MQHSSKPCAGERWRNKHTGEITTIISIEAEGRERPTRLSQAHDGRLIFLNYEPYEATMVRFVGGAPPGYDDRRCGGWEIDSFTEHWEPV